MPKRPARKSGAEAPEKLAGEKKDSPATKPDEGAKADAEPRPASGAAKAGRAEKKADAPAFIDPEAAKPATGRGKKKNAAGMEVSEERSGDQPVQADATWTHPVRHGGSIVRVRLHGLVPAPLFADLVHPGRVLPFPPPGGRWIF